MTFCSPSAFRLAGRATETSTMRRRTAVAGLIPVRTMPRHSRSEPNGGTFLRIPVMRSRSANISVAASRTTVHRRALGARSPPRVGTGAPVITTPIAPKKP
jgi:hypothetical protein